MRTKINEEYILRLAYKVYKNMLNEDVDGVETKQQNEPVDFHPSFFRGNYYFNVTVKDKSLFGKLSNFSTMMAGRAMRSAEKMNKPFSENDFKRIKSMYRVVSDNNTVNNDTQYMILKVKVDSPETLLSDDGKPSWESRDIRKIWNVLTTLKKFGMDIPDEEVHNAFNTMFHYVANKPNKDSEAQVSMETQKLFFKICQTLGEDETKQLLRTIQITDDGFIADHQYSLQNKLRIIAQAMIYDQNGGNQVGTISYLATPRQWRKMGRRVVDFSHPYHTVTFNGGRSSQNAEIEFAKTRGISPLTVNESDANGVGFNAGRGLNAAVNADMYGRSSFSYNDAVYDVQATEVISGQSDKFADEPGMKNNLTGELNDVALQKIGSDSDPASKEEKGDRAAKLNGIFGTNDYENVDLTYKAACMTFGTKPSLGKESDVQSKIKETGNMIDKMLIKKLSGFKDGEGHIAKPENYLPLVNVGRIIIQAIIGLPMDDAPAIRWANEHEQLAAALSTPVHAISNSILRNKSAIKMGGKTDISEMLETCAPLLLFEDTFNNTLKLIKKNAEN